VELKKEWLNYANSMNKPISKVIIEAMNRMIHLKPLDGEEVLKQQFDLLEQSLKQQLVDLDEKIETKVAITSPVENSDDLEERILLIVGSPQTSMNISKILSIDEHTVTKMLYQMKNTNVKYNLKKDTWERI
jgi:hypothetical protein